MWFFIVVPTFFKKMANFPTEESQKDFFERKKREIIESEKSVKNALTETDRQTLRDFFGYTNGAKTMAEVPVYVKDCLFVEENDKNETKTEVVGRSSLSRIFPEREKWWKIGSSLTPTEQISCLRAYQTFSRIYSTDVCMKRLRYGTKILLTGPVSKFGHKRRIDNLADG